MVNAPFLNPSFEILIRDFGKKFDPSAVKQPKLPPDKPGGLGLYFIKKLMDKVEYRWIENPAGNEIYLAKFKKA